MTQYVFEPQVPVTVPVVGSDEQFPVRRVFTASGVTMPPMPAKWALIRTSEPPFFFCKPADAVVPVAAGETLALPYPAQTDNYHYEIELVVAIGKKGSDIPLENAHEYVWGYATGLDMTRRDRQMEMRQMGRPWEIGKAFDLSAPIAPLHKASDIGGIDNAPIWLQVNGEGSHCARAIFVILSGQ